MFRVTEKILGKIKGEKVKKRSGINRGGIIEDRIKRRNNRGGRVEK
jgi:hypothetical protein